jgi:hypothetical protein
LVGNRIWFIRHPSMIRGADDDGWFSWHENGGIFFLIFSAARPALWGRLILYMGLLSFGFRSNPTRGYESSTQWQATSLCKKNVCKHQSDAASYLCLFFFFFQASLFAFVLNIKMNEDMFWRPSFFFVGRRVFSRRRVAQPQFDVRRNTFHTTDN